MGLAQERPRIRRITDVGTPTGTVGTAWSIAAAQTIAPMRKRIVLLLFLVLVDCQSPNKRYDKLVVKSAQWTGHDAARVCMFFGDNWTKQPYLIACWQSEDGKDLYNRNDEPNDHFYVVDIDVPKEAYRRIAEGHNEKLYCTKDTDTHLLCVH